MTLRARVIMRDPQEPGWEKQVFPQSGYAAEQECEEFKLKHEISAHECGFVMELEYEDL